MWSYSISLNSTKAKKSKKTCLNNWSTTKPCPTWTQNPLKFQKLTVWLRFEDFHFKVFLNYCIYLKRKSKPSEPFTDANNFVQVSISVDF